MPLLNETLQTNKIRLIDTAALIHYPVSKTQTQYIHCNACKPLMVK